MTLRRIMTLLAMAALAVAAGAALWQSLPATEQASVESVAAGLRCPSCEGESVADSRSPVAAAMREVIETQLAAGRSPEEIRSWFADRYGPEVLDLPAGTGAGAALWILPAVVLLAGLLLAWRAARRTRPTTTPPATTPPAGSPPARTRRAWQFAAVGLVAMVTAIALAGGALRDGAAPADARAPDPVAAELTLARSLEEDGEYAAAAEVYRSVYAQRPDDGLRLRLAFTLLRADAPDEALPLAQDAAAAHPDDPEALLILGLAERATGSPDAESTLRDFLDAAPDHPAAAEVRRLLGG